MILVVGATGNIGRELVPLLRQAGEAVRALTRAGDKGGTLPEGVESVAGDLNDPASLDRALEGAEKAFLVSPPDPHSVEMQSNFIDAAKRAGLKRLVKSSVFGAQEGSGGARFVAWHKQIEDHLMASGVPYTLVRPNLFMQGMTAYAPTVKATGTLPLPQGDGKVSLVDTRDIAAVAAAALTQDGHAGKAYDATGLLALTAGEVAHEIGAAAGREVKYADITPDEFKRGLRGAGLPDWMADGLAELEQYYREGRASRVSHDIAAVTGRPARGFSAWAAENAGAFQGG